MTIDVLRKRQRRAGVIVDGEDFSMDRGSAAPSSGPNPVERITLEEVGEQIGKAIEKLPERQRSVIVLRYYEDMSIKEIAAVIGCTEGTVKTHLFRATGKLRGLLDYMRSSEQKDE
jgi:RNA polymerase sigma-70 factor (ECF subfamily)